MSDAQDAPTLHISQVSVTAPARLHLGFLDLNGGLGRRFGSLGLALREPCTSVTARPAARLTIEGSSSAKARKYARRLMDHFGISRGVHISVGPAIPEHVGLGSGTQLAIAVGMAIARLFELNLDARHIAQFLDRGVRSGIGVGAFEQGGFLVDGGHGTDDRLPVVTSRIEFPTHWRILLVLDNTRCGMHGNDERRAFAELAEFPAELAAHLCRLTLMQALPALAESDLERFGQAVTEIQQRVGDYFAPIQGGRFASPAVAEILAWLKNRGVAAVGQSSWGPTGFAIVDSETRAFSLMRKAQIYLDKQSPLNMRVVQARNRGSIVETTEYVNQNGLVRER